MKSLISKTLLLCTMAISLFSFTAKPGGEGFEIFVDNKLMIQRFGHDINTVQSLQLNQQSGNEKLLIKYHHCGRVGKNRVIAIKDAQNVVLKEFRYSDPATASSAMSLEIKDILGLKKKGTGLLKLFYTSSELPGGRLLTTINP
ncbi:MAG: hypothetical protein JNM19_09120 [Chitinophagaceae bacterium]|nr:hypothetical protein [Chitinophagaceae bacterium]